jgi:monomeric sarcosine oxidase
MTAVKTYDVAVVGAGVFGAWTALHLAKRGKRVLLLEAYGPGHSRSSSGDESRIIRMGYGAEEIYTRWSQGSLTQWKQLFAATHNEELFKNTGVLWMAAAGDPTLRATREVLTRRGVKFKEFDRAALASKCRQMKLDGIAEGIFEPESGVLMARRAVAAVVEEAVRLGTEYRVVEVNVPGGSCEISGVNCRSSGEPFHAGQYVFACGAWLKKLFPEILGQRIFVTRQPVFYVSVPPGDDQFTAAKLPTWLIQNDECYGMPDLESRGLKVALDRHGEPADPDTQSRLVTSAEVAEMRDYVARRFPALADAPIAETRVCQYENTSSGDFLVDRHPSFSNVWFAGGGSGHGFKHGPALGEYVTNQVLGGGKAEPRFLLQNKETVQKRSVY